ncbi:protein FAM200A-like [Cardiocondyla obscurior]|uniref:protein FAM200A-like n=1 Tax=Cardiocondyla obscurior TaxID=286306 RepID=UPI0039657C72
MNVESLVPFDDEKKAAEIRYAAFITEKNILFETAQDILTLFKEIGKDSKIIKGMTMNRKKCKGIISNVLCPIETNRVVDILQNNKFSIFVDETSDISNQKWMTFLVRYVDPEMLDSRSQLVKLINIDAKNSSAEKLFDAFLNEMWKLQIPFQNIIAMSCDNAHVMVGKYSSFKTKLQKFCHKLLTFSCSCHSAALIAHNACSKIPEHCEEFVKKVATFINSSPKRSAIFEEFAISFQETNHKIFKLSDTRWLSRYSSIERLLEYWNTLFLFLTEIVVNKKTKSGEYILSIMQKPDTKAYLLFLKHILYHFNLFFQSLETRIQVLNRKSLEFLCGICRNFLKPELLSSLKEIDMPEFDKTENQISINEIYLEEECRIYLNNLITEGHADVVANIRRDCLQFYVTAAQDICKRLPIRDAFLSKLKVFEFNTALRDSNRESSFRDVSYIVSTFGGFDEKNLKKEWFALYEDFSESDKDLLAILEFDELWKKILKSHRYPNLKSVLNAVRSLPNSNADSERIFSFLPDIKTKKRNKLAPANVNALYVFKSALKARKETALNININEEHLSLMSTDKLYSTCHKKQESHITLYTADDCDMAGPSSSTML